MKVVEVAVVMAVRVKVLRVVIEARCVEAVSEAMATAAKMAPEAAMAVCLSAGEAKAALSMAAQVG